MEKGG